MLLLRDSILARLLSSSAASPSPFSLHRLISAAAAAVSPIPSFAVEEYLVDSCGLTRAQALKASTKLAHLKSPSNPDAVLAFLAGLGLSSAEAAAVVAKDPLFLCAGVDRTLAHSVVGLTGLGLSRAEIARLLSLAPVSFRCRSVVPNLSYYLNLFGSQENLFRALKGSSCLLSHSLAKVVEPNVAFLQECGIDGYGIAKLFIGAPRIVGTKPEQVRAMAARAAAVGVPHSSRMFRHALHAVAFLSEEKVAARVESLKNMFRWSDAEVGIAVSKHPQVLALSKEMLQGKSEFLISEVKLEPAHIAHHPALLCYSFEARLRPRYCVLKFLKENGLLDRDWTYYSAVKVTEKVFVKKYISPHNEAAPYLAEDYATTCKGEVPPTFRST